MPQCQPSTNAATGSAVPDVKPPSAQQQKILAFPYSRYDAIICDGAIRSGKTSLATVAYVDWAMREFDGKDFIFLGNSVGAVRRNVILPYEGLAYARRRYKMDYNASSSVLTVSKGKRRNRFYVFGANNVRSYQAIQGMTAAGCFVDEAALLDQMAVDTATGRCSVEGARLFFNTNPSYPSHWFKREWIDRADELNALYLRFTMDDNPSLSDKVKEQYKRRYRGVFYDRYILGLWVVAEGLVYQFDSPDEFTASDKEAAGDGKGEWAISIDYGITNPFAAILWRVTPSRAYAVREYYFDSRALGRRRTDREHYEAVEQLAEGLPVYDLVVDPSANSFKEEAWRAGRFNVYDADNAVIDGITLTDQMLHDGSIKIGEACVNTIREMGLYRWNNKAQKDEVIKEDDHAMDAMRYMAQTRLKFMLRGYA